MIAFILGGVKGGKSMFAQHLTRMTAKDTHLYYFATMIPSDNEDKKRIARHIKDRENWGYTTIEEGINICSKLNEINRNSTVLFDSVTAYVQNNMFSLDENTQKKNIIQMSEDILQLAAHVENTVIVSDYIFSDAVEYHESVYHYLEALGSVHIEIAKKADLVIECSFSNIKIHKNSLNFNIKPIIEESLKTSSHLLYSDI